MSGINWEDRDRPSAIRRLFEDTRGVTAVEFAFLLPIYILFIFFILQIGVIHFARASLETATEAASRQLLTNSDNGFTQAQFKTQVCQNLPDFMNCSSLMVDVQAYNPGVNPYPSFTFDANSHVTNTWSVPPCIAQSCAGQQLMVRAMYPWGVISPLGQVLSNMPNGALLLMSVQVLQVES
jgi:Flp pilus assembly protein TadG